MLYPRKTGKSHGSFGNAPDVKTICFLYAQRRLKFCSCAFVNDAFGLKSRAQTIPPLPCTPQTPAARRPARLTHQPHLINTSRRRYTHFARLLRMSEYAWLFPCTPGRLSTVPGIHFGRPGTRARCRTNPRTNPRRHPHGGTGAFSAQIPNRSCFARCSNRARCNSFLAYCRYHHAHPARNISADTSRPSGNNTWQTFRPYLSPSRRRTTRRLPSHRPRRNAREARNPICPCSGASIPQRRTRTISPRSNRISKVSPSKH